jgi:hypothetical protein
MASRNNAWQPKSINLKAAKALRPPAIRPPSKLTPHQRSAVRPLIVVGRYEAVGLGFRIICHAVARFPVEVKRA